MQLLLQVHRLITKLLDALLVLLLLLGLLAFSFLHHAREFASCLFPELMLIYIGEFTETLSDDFFHRFIDQAQHRGTIQYLDGPESPASQLIDSYSVGAFLKCLWHIEGLTHRPTVLQVCIGDFRWNLTFDALAPIC